MYQVRLQDFEGPLDLLLFFVQRDELDIHDIPIAQIADEYLRYVRLIQEIDLDGAGDFIFMAAVLIGIKARMLLPRPQVDAHGEEVDPRQELTERLLAYARYKEASLRLSSLHEARSEHFTRGDASGARARYGSAREVRYRVSVFELISALQQVLVRAPEAPVHDVTPSIYTIEQQQVFLLSVLTEKQLPSFKELVGGRSRPFIVTTFLAVLELIRLGRITVMGHAQAGDFSLSLAGESVQKRMNGSYLN